MTEDIVPPSTWPICTREHRGASRDGAHRSPRRQPSSCCGGTVALLCKPPAGPSTCSSPPTATRARRTLDRTGQQMLAAEREEEQRRGRAPSSARTSRSSSASADGQRARPTTSYAGWWCARAPAAAARSVVITWDGFRPGFNHRDHRFDGPARPTTRSGRTADDRLFLPRAPIEDEGLEPHRPQMMLLGGATEPDVVTSTSSRCSRLKVAGGVTAHVSQVGGRSPEQLCCRWWRERAGDRVRASRGEETANRSRASPARRSGASSGRANRAAEPRLGHTRRAR